MSLFSQIKVVPPKRNKFNLSHDLKTTTEFGRLTPCFVADVVPGDTFQVRTDMLLRMMPLTAPVMQQFDVYTHFFFVPNRLIWDGWEEFITGGKNGQSSIQKPTFSFRQSYVNKHGNLTGPSSLMNYLGYPYIADANKDSVNWREVDAMPFRAYHLIWNEYYRDETIDTEIDIHSNWSGHRIMDSVAENNVTTKYVLDMLQLHNRCWKKDYFTSALPWTQRSQENVSLPLRGAGSITGSNAITMKDFTLEAASNGGDTSLELFNKRVSNADDQVIPFKGAQLQGDLNGNAKVDLSDGIETTINDVRRAFALQKFLEKQARGGYRYIETILSHFGVRSSDARLQRPEYLGGGSLPIIVGDVLQTSESTSNSPLASYAGVGTGSGSLKQFRAKFEEHGFIIGILSVMPKASYMQGVPKMYLKKDRYDYYWSDFAHIGEQPIENQELYQVANADGHSVKPENVGTFGYTPRYAEYKFMNSRTNGEFVRTLNYWHDGRIFDKAPKLNSEFLQVSTDISNPDNGLNRIFAYEKSVDSEGLPTDHLMIIMHFDVNAVRPMPRFGTPLI